MERFKSGDAACECLTFGPLKSSKFLQNSATFHVGGIVKRQGFNNRVQALFFGVQSIEHNGLVFFQINCQHG